MQQYVPTTLNKRDKNELSIYKEGSIDPDVLGSGIKTIALSFPRLPKGWYDVLKEMLIDEKFDNNRFSDAVKSLVKNCPYPEPTIANIIGYDKTIKVYTIEELREKHKDAYYMNSTAGDPINRDYAPINFYGQKRFAKKEDIERYNLTKWVNKQKEQKWIE